MNAIRINHALERADPRENHAVFYGYTCQTKTPGLRHWRNLMSDIDHPRLDHSSRICRHPSVLATEVEGEVVMMDMEKGLYFGLDSVGTYIWNRLETPMSVSELVSVLRHKYAGDSETIERDVLALMSKMAEQGLVEVS